MWRTIASIAILACATASLAESTQAADALRIETILPLTGGGSFLGKGQRETLSALETQVNKEGGVAGARLQFVYRDDQSSPQMAVQLTRSAVAANPPAILGSSLVAMCNAMAPLLKGGPFDYCLSPGAHPAAGGFQFSSSVNTHDLLEALVRYFRLRRLTKIAFLASTDASGQDAEQGLDDVLKMPENAAVSVVARQRFNPTDVSISAQMERIVDARPQALIAWSTGAPIATVFKAALQAGLDAPIGTTNGNQTFAQMEQYKNFLPKELYIPTSEFPQHAGLFKLDPRVEAEQRRFYSALQAAGAKPDNMAALSWDPANLLVAALRKLGAKATAQDVRSFVAAQTDFPGVNGVYNFKKTPQRGLTVDSAVVTRWDPVAHTWTAVSKPAGVPL